MRLRTLIWSCLFVLLPQALFASDPPVSRRNPQNTHTEIVDMIQLGGQYEIRHTIDDGTTKPVALTITSDPANDRRPRIAIAPNGDTWVCWYRELPSGDRVICRKRDYTTKTWSDERLVSVPEQSGRLPVVVHDGSKAWTAFEVDSGSGTSIVVKSIVDVPDPIGCHEVRWTPFTGDLEVELHFEAGHLWITWLDGTNQIGWAEYDFAAGEWGPNTVGPYISFLLDQMRETIRAFILGQ